MNLKAFRGLLILLFCWVYSAQALDVPELTGRVVDNAGMLSEASRGGVAASLQELEQKKGAQLVLLTIPGLQGESLEDYSIRVAEAWKLGRKGVDDGVLLLVARDDRQIRIEVGYGLEGVLTDLDSRRIIDNLMVPAFRSADFEGGIEAAVKAISGAIQGEVGAIPVKAVSKGALSDGSFMALGFFSLFLIPLAWLAVALKAPQGWTLYLFTTPFFYAVPLMFGKHIALMSVVTWLVIVGILRFIWPEKWKIESGTGSGGGGSGGFGGGGFTGGGGFSGGGGSFGGGGASGGW